MSSLLESSGFSALLLSHRTRKNQKPDLPGFYFVIHCHSRKGQYMNAFSWRKEKPVRRTLNAFFQCWPTHPLESWSDHLGFSNCRANSGALPPSVTLLVFRTGPWAGILVWGFFLAGIDTCSIKVPSKCIVCAPWGLSSSQDVVTPVKWIFTFWMTEKQNLSYPFSVELGISQVSRSWKEWCLSPPMFQDSFDCFCTLHGSDALSFVISQEINWGYSCISGSLLEMSPTWHDEMSDWIKPLWSSPDWAKAGTIFLNIELEKNNSKIL